MGTGCKQDRHIMVAVNLQEKSENAVIYVADMLGNVPGFRVTLFCLISTPPDEHFESIEERNRWIEEEQLKVDAMLDRMRIVCIKAGFREDKVAVKKSTGHCQSVAERLIKEASVLGACTLVMARRGTSQKEEFLFGSTSSQVLHDARDLAIWVVE